MQHDEALTTRDVARLLDLSETRIRQLEAAGALRSARTPRGLRIFKRNDVERLASERRLRSQAKLEGRE